ncbi:MAG TPA: hypothetical protein VFK62_03775 [Gaiellaceae bacterium]|jgi:hypothetical protein|nr:hypothetical protein [Gaiellaceae bacterium]
MRRLVPFAVVLLLLATLSAAAAIGASGKRRHVSQPEGLALSGHVVGLLPGQHARMTIHVKNRLHRTIHLRSLKTTVRAAAPGCGGRNLVVAAYHGRLRIRAGGWSRVFVSVRMRLDSPNACQGKIFPLTFKGQASA